MYELTCMFIDNVLVQIQDIALTAAIPGTHDWGIKLLISFAEILSPDNNNNNNNCDNNNNNNNCDNNYDNTNNNSNNNKINNNNLYLIIISIDNIFNFLVQL